MGPRGNLKIFFQFFTEREVLFSAIDGINPKAVPSEGGLLPG